MIGQPIFDYPSEFRAPEGEGCPVCGIVLEDDQILGHCSPECLEWPDRCEGCRRGQSWCSCEDEIPAEVRPTSIAFLVWNVFDDESKASHQHEFSPKTAAELHATAAFAADPQLSWPQIYNVRDTTTDDVWRLTIERVVEPRILTTQMRTVPMKPTTHILWATEVLCNDKRLKPVPTRSAPSKDHVELSMRWPAGQRHVTLVAFVEGVAVAEEDRCPKCWAKAPEVVARLRQISPPPSER